MHAERGSQRGREHRFYPGAQVRAPAEWQPARKKPTAFARLFPKQLCSIRRCPIISKPSVLLFCFALGSCAPVTEDKARDTAVGDTGAAGDTGEADSEEEAVPCQTPRSAGTLSRPSDAAKSVAESTRTFSWDLFQAAAEPEKNAFISPFSVAIALSMTEAGAKNGTANQLDAALGITGDTASWHSGMGELMAFLGADPSWDALETPCYRLHLANRVWGQTDFPFLTDYLGLLEDSYNAPMSVYNFRGDPEGGRQDINTWVSEQTEGVIRELLAEGDISDATRLALVNAIYFKADWLTPFDSDDTKTRDFTLASGDTSSVEMMYQELSAAVSVEDGYTVVRLPYDGESVSFTLVLPDDADGLASLEEGLDADTINRWIESPGSERDIRLHLPRLSLDLRTDLPDALMDMGVVHAFDEALADLTGMYDPTDLDGINLYVKKVVHHAVLELDEEGTTAAAATAVIVDSTDSAPEPPLEVNVDHPFLFFIAEKQTGTLLFLGHVADPNEESE